MAKKAPTVGSVSPRLRGGVLWLLLWLAPGVGGVAIGLTAQRFVRPSTFDAVGLPDGPWGELYGRAAVLEAPASDVTPAVCGRSPSIWLFKGSTPQQVDRLLAGIGLDDHLRETLLRGANCDSNGCAVRPNDATIIGLSEPQRVALYRTLGAHAENTDFYQPFSVPLDEKDLWFRGTDMAPATRDLLQKLTFRDGDALRMTDLSLLCRVVPDDEKSSLLRALFRAPALNLELFVRQGSDVSGLARWWSRGMRSEGVRPLLEALARTPGGGRIDVTQLLPPFARARLNRFPEAAEAQEDCHYTSLNFDSGQPNELYSDRAVASRAFETDYTPIPLSEAAFGDRLLVMRDGKGIHSAVFIGADILFTKNGRSDRAPWQFMRLRNLSALYPGTQYVMRRNRAAMALGLVGK